MQDWEREHQEREYYQFRSDPSDLESVAETLARYQTEKESDSTELNSVTPVLGREPNRRNGLLDRGRRSSYSSDLAKTSGSSPPASYSDEGGDES